MDASPLTDAAAVIRGMTTLQKRLEELLAAMSWGEAELIRASGASRSAVAQWLGKGSKEIKSIRMPYALALERETGFSAEWLAYGKLPKKAAIQPIQQQNQGAEQVAQYAAVLALLTSHPEPEKLLVAFDAIVSTLASRGDLHEQSMAALQRLRLQLVRQAEAGKRPSLR
jgi:hypothetical protein